MKGTLTIVTAMWLLSFSAVATERSGRPMIIHRLPELGLEIWTEQDPEWETHLSEANGAVTFVAETPALTYPPAYMSWTSLPRIELPESDFEVAARGAIHQAAANYGVRSIKNIPIESRRYGDLSGYEGVFAASSSALPADIRVFCGRQPGRPAVVMQVVTLKNKLGHLNEQLRRSWTHVRYLGR
jgi:hypothetical protein